MKRIIQEMENNKSSGSDNIETKLIKYAWEEISQEIHELTKQVWHDIDAYL